MADSMADRVINWLFGVLTRPAPTLNEIAREKPVGWAMLVYVGVGVLSGTASIFSEGTYGALQNLMHEFAFYLSSAVIVFGSLLFSVMSLFVSSLLLHLFARLFGGQGGFWNLFSAYSFASFPMIFSVPVVLIGNLLGVFGMILSGLVSFVLAVWVIVLDVIAIRESHALTTGMSILTYIIYLVILFVIPVALVVILVMAFMVF